jgi:hypothetical protein
MWGVVSTGNVTTYTVSDLPPNQNYYFWVNAVNGCMPGDPIDPEIHLGSSVSSSYPVSTGNPAPGTLQSSNPASISTPHSYTTLPPTGPEDVIKAGAVGVIFSVIGGVLFLAL